MIARNVDIQQSYPVITERRKREDWRACISVGSIDADHAGRENAGSDKCSSHEGEDGQEVKPMETSKEILVQYCELREEIKDLRERIDRDKRRLERIESEGVVSDTVRGTRKDGTIGPIKITGFPLPEYEETKSMLKKRIAKLGILEDELQEAVNAVDDYIASIPKSDLRQMFRLYYLDDLTWAKVALNMNARFPHKKIPYTEDSCRMRHNRYLEI